MNYIRINKFSKVPLYLQLKDSIKAAILSGILKDKDKLPTEEFIGQVFNVSRPVVRQAYQSLIDEGLITRHQGKGTFVEKKVNFSNIFFKKNFNEEVLLKGFQPSSYFISFDIISAKDLPPFNLEIPHYPYYYLIKRVRSADDIPISYELFFLPTQLFENLEDKLDNEMSLTKMITEDYNYTNLLGECLISAVELDDSIAGILKLKSGSVAIKFDIVHTDQNLTPIFFKITYYPGERNSIDVEIKGDNDGLH
jgi:DNA-binding GntR family transcriptional regulator